jgi:hypothetical protein
MDASDVQQVLIYFTTFSKEHSIGARAHFFSSRFKIFEVSDIEEKKPFEPF